MAERRIHCALTEHPLQLQRCHEFIADPAAGGNVVFVGSVRSPDQGESVSSLHYEAYESMALESMRSAAAACLERFDDVKHVYIEHRTGTVEPGEPSIAVGVSSGHRQAAFEGCRFVLDTVKSDAAIWKQSVLETGEREWLGSSPPEG